VSSACEFSFELRIPFSLQLLLSHHPSFCVTSVLGLGLFSPNYPLRAISIGMLGSDWQHGSVLSGKLFRLSTAVMGKFSIVQSADLSPHPALTCEYKGSDGCLIRDPKTHNASQYDTMWASAVG
jgi:hypothetical protein